MPNIAAGIGLLGLGVMMVVAVGTIAYSLFCDQPLSYDEEYSRRNARSSATWNTTSDCSSTTRAVRRKRKERNSSELPCNDLCSICKEIIETHSLKILPCDHCFHAECIRDWFDSCTSYSSQETGTCPMCRRKFSDRDLK